ncbi:MAG: hypothetical protein IJR43_09920, partial [Synergistaceae bacterium]|nr:hypothetical protein [Synergistaceae bacterium]
MCHSLNDERQKFIDTIKQLGNNAILLLIHKDGNTEALFISQDYAAMMEDTPENLMHSDFRASIYPEDISLAEYMLTNHESQDKSHKIRIRKVTSKNNIKWCDVHFAFVNLNGEDYIYITYSDITLFKSYEEKMRTSFDSIGQNFYHQDKFTLGMFRAD